MTTISLSALSRPNVFAALAELWNYRDLLRQLVARELKIRYKNSALGFLWSIVPPLLQVFVYTFFARAVMGQQAYNYPAYLLCGLIPWTFFSTALLDASQSILNNYYIIRKVYMPREVIPLAIVISNFIHFLLGWAVFFVYFLIVAQLMGKGGIPLLPSMVWFPVLLVFQFLLVAGLALWVAALNVFYEDVKFILQTLLNLLIFLIPVLYPADRIHYTPLMEAHPWLFRLYMLNPITALIDGFRRSLLEPLFPEAFSASLKGQPPSPLDWPVFLGAALLCVVIAWSGYEFFNRRKWLFVERG